MNTDKKRRVFFVALENFARMAGDDATLLVYLRSPVFIGGQLFGKFKQVILALMRRFA